MLINLFFREIFNSNNVFFCIIKIFLNENELENTFLKSKILNLSFLINKLDRKLVNHELVCLPQQMTYHVLEKMEFIKKYIYITKCVWARRPSSYTILGFFKCFSLNFNLKSFQLIYLKYITYIILLFIKLIIDILQILFY